ncbi:MAG TPA: hypothetical protein ENJ18_14205 [Nannocystis exedens]|nr:hypothetical protein [Nannocystis exedens]
MRLTIQTFNLQAVERSLCALALNEGGSIVRAAALLGITRHSLKRRITKHCITWPVRQIASVPGIAAAVVVSSPPTGPVSSVMPTAEVTAPEVTPSVTAAAVVVSSPPTSPVGPVAPTAAAPAPAVTPSFTATTQSPATVFSSPPIRE